MNLNFCSIYLTQISPNHQRVLTKTEIEWELRDGLQITAPPPRQKLWARFAKLITPRDYTSSLFVTCRRHSLWASMLQRADSSQIQYAASRLKRRREFGSSDAHEASIFVLIRADGFCDAPTHPARSGLDSMQTKSVEWNRDDNHITHQRVLFPVVFVNDQISSHFWYFADAAMPCVCD